VFVAPPNKPDIVDRCKEVMDIGNGCDTVYRKKCNAHTEETKTDKALFCILHAEVSLMIVTQERNNIDTGIEKIGDSVC
jgi:hypothetical protein